MKPTTEILENISKNSTKTRFSQGCIGIFYALICTMSHIRIFMQIKVRQQKALTTIQLTDSVKKRLIELFNR